MLLYLPSPIHHPPSIHTANIDGQPARLLPTPFPLTRHIFTPQISSSIHSKTSSCERAGCAITSDSNPPWLREGHGLRSRQAGILPCTNPTEYLLIRTSRWCPFVASHTPWCCLGNPPSFQTREIASICHIHIHVHTLTTAKHHGRHVPKNPAGC